MEWSIQEVAKFTGTTSRTLRHYGDIGLLEPSRVGHGGLRYYDSDALSKLQRILLLRGLGLGLPAITEVLSQQTDTASALGKHIEWLEREKDRIDRQIASVQRTLTSIEHGGEITMEAMLDGFDHTQYEDEVRQRWGDNDWKDSNNWWSGLSKKEQQEFTQRSADVNGTLRRIAESDLAPGSTEFQQAVADHYAWLESQPIATYGRERYLGLADMYVADNRFAATYGGTECAERIREAIGIWVDQNL
ncbi:MerR family transcriptional regulator [Leucobacter sp. GX24907]